LASGQGPHLYNLPEGTPFAYKRVVAAFEFLVDAADRPPNAATNTWPDTDPARAKRPAGAVDAATAI
jgi:hypothetical protein